MSKIKREGVKKVISDIIDDLPIIIGFTISDYLERIGVKLVKRKWRRVWWRI